MEKMKDRNQIEMNMDIEYHHGTRSQVYEAA